ncbi:MAG TPA: hypothetical protein VLE43_14035 [Candidatus Saccharimonadia bacterium]|nr:hypothetical protein [Candidatus Saccharimonadia bacterium]
MIKFKALLKESDVRKFTAADLSLPSLPKDGDFLIQEIAKRHASDFAAFPRQNHFTESLEITSHNAASMTWYDDRGIRFIIWNGDLTIDGDLLDEDFSMLPILLVRGNLTVRNWLRGGLSTFVSGNVKASGFIIGHYNDSALFVGGDLTAAGYIPRAKPYKDLPKLVPHQIAGKVSAKKFDNLNATDTGLRAAFVDEVLTVEGGDTYLDERAVFERSDAGLPVWK